MAPPTKEVDIPANFPQVRARWRLTRGDKEDSQTFFDVRFYPYSVPGTDPVFAATGNEGDTIVCRCCSSGGQVINVLRFFHDEAEGELRRLNSLVWSKDLETGHPLVCVSGEDSRIKILDIVTGKLARTLVGHGGMVNDLVVSPQSPNILASASMDRSIRIWNLGPKYEKNPCGVILAGEGHGEGVLSMDIHRKGRYLISGGHDTRVNLWIIPEDVGELPRSSTEGSSRKLVKKINFPHFSTVEIHSDYVDCIRFHDDLILSRSAEEDRILLWKIDGFSTATDDVPPQSAAPIVTGTDYPTTSAFGGRFQRLLTFQATGSTTNWMRFGLFTAPNQNPMLAVGQDTFAITEHKMAFSILFWDLKLLEDGIMPVAADGEKSFGLHDPLTPIPPHRKVKMPPKEFDRSFCIRSVAWSPDGTWCVAGDECGYLYVLSRPSNSAAR